MYGVPKKIVSDRGTSYTSRKFAEFCDQNEIEHKLTSVQHPQSNGQV